MGFGLSILGYVLALAGALALVAYILYRRYRSRQELEAKVADLTALADIGRAITDAPFDLASLTDTVYQQASHIVDTTIFQLGIFQEDRYRLLVWVFDGQRQPLQEFRLTPDSLGIVGWIRQSQRSLLVRDFEAERETLPARPRYISSDPPRSAVFVPLIAGDEVLGAIAIQSRRPGAFDEQHLRLLTIVANHAAAALLKAQLYEQANQQAHHLSALVEVSKQINVLQPLPALYRQIVATLSDRLAGNEIGLYTVAAGQLRLQASTVAGRRGPPVVVNVSDSDALAAVAAADRRSIARETLPEIEAGPAEATDRHAEMAIPVLIDERILGVLEVRSRTQNHFGLAEKGLFEGLAAQIAFAILEAELYAAEQRQTERLAAIAQVSRTIVSNLDLSVLFDEVLDLIEDSFGYKRLHIFVRQGRNLVFSAGSGRGAARWLTRGLTYDLAGPGMVAKAGRTRQALLAADITAIAEYAAETGLEDTRSEMAAPMQMGADLLGVFDVQSERVGEFGAQDLQLLQTLADTLAVAIRNARLFDAERRRRRLAETLREVSAALTSTLNLDDVLGLILTGLARVMHYDAASILLANEAGELILRAARGGHGLVDLIGESLDLRLISTAKPVLQVDEFASVDPDHIYHDLVGLPDPHACLSAVLTLRHEPIGYLIVDRAGEPVFPASEIEFVSAFASQASVAIENARLYTAQLEQAWVSSSLLQVAEATTQASELDEILLTVARLTPMLTGVDRCGVLLLADGAFELRAYQQGDAAEAPNAVMATFAVADWPILADLRARRAPIVVDTADEPGALPPALRDLLPETAVLIPLVSKSEVVGALAVGQAVTAGSYAQHRAQLLGGIANQTALAIESARLYEAQQEEAWVSAALLQVAEAVAQQPTLEDGLDAVTRLTPMLVGLERVVIYRWDSATGRFNAAGMAGFQRDHSLAIARLPWTAEDFELDPRVNATLPSFQLNLSAARSDVFECDKVLVWPLWARGDLLGALMVEYVPLEVLGRRLSILDGIAHQLSLAMDNARLERELALQHKLERDVEMARDIQASFLPEACPTVPGWDLCAFWQAARQVGGDFYDFIHLRPTETGGDRWGIIIADVADKGMPAALFMALSRTLMRTVAINRIAPAATLSRVNELVNADAKTDLFVTIFYAVWEPGKGTFTYVNAGHNPPVLVVRQGEPALLEGRGVPVGVFEEAAYVENQISVEPGETLLLYTDGLPDAVNTHNEEFGMPRVLDILQERANATAAEILESVSGGVLAHVGVAETFDDLTMVVIKRTLNEPVSTLGEL